MVWMRLCCGTSLPFTFRTKLLYYLLPTGRCEKPDLYLGGFLSSSNNALHVLALSVDLLFQLFLLFRWRLSVTLMLLVKVKEYSLTGFSYSWNTILNIVSPYFPLLSRKQGFSKTSCYQRPWDKFCFLFIWWCARLCPSWKCGGEDGDGPDTNNRWSNHVTVWFKRWLPAQLSGLPSFSLKAILF